jgi:YHS domain-containing protein
MKNLVAAIVLLTSAASAFAEETKPAYPLTTCVVSGEKLGEMGKPYVVTYEGRDIELCCSSCRKSFDKDPAKFVKAYDAALAAKAAKAR